MTITYLSLGSNMGDRIGYLQQALTQLSMHPKLKLLSASSFYETEPVGGTPDQATLPPEDDWFVNVAVAMETTLTPDDLMTYCLKVEQQLGRKRDPQQPYGPRTIDIDVLFYDALIYQSPLITVPHPELHKRAFVLVPLLEINPRLIHPQFNKSVEQLHHAMDAPEEVYLFGTRQLFENMS
jgi:2-amino-4-hydroxy-6-hydroxymethyldihydropteridine diphosphokinase